MLNIANISRVYFLGILGIGMSAIAKYFNAKGVTVSGYDKTPTAITRRMEEDGIAINYIDSDRLSSVGRATGIRRSSFCSS